MLAVEPDLLGERRRRSPGHARVGHERQDDHHPAARRRGRAPPAGRVVTNHTGANLAGRRRADLARATGPARRGARGRRTRACRRSSTRCDAELLVLGNLSRDQLDRYGEVRASPTAWRGVSEPHPDLRSSPTRRIRTSCGPAAPPQRHLGRARARGGGATRRRARRAARCSSGPTTGSHCPRVRRSPSPTPRTASTATRRHPRRPPRPDRARAPRRWNRAERRARVVTAAIALRRRPDVAVGAGRGRRPSPVASCTYRSPTGARRRVLLAKNPAGWTEAASRRRAGRTAASSLAVNAHVADGKDPSWLWDVPYERLRGPPVAAAGERALDVAVRLATAASSAIVEPDPLAAARRAARRRGVDIIASYTQFSALTAAPAIDARPRRARGDGPRRCASVSCTRSCSGPTATAATRSCSWSAAGGAASRPSSSRSTPATPIPDSPRRVPLRRRRGRPAGDGRRGHAGVRQRNRARPHEAAPWCFAVCAGFQLDRPPLRRRRRRGARRPRPRRHGHRAPGPTGSSARWSSTRPVAARVRRPAPALTGFENHGGRTTLGPGVEPLGRVVVGGGNGDGGGRRRARRAVRRHLPARTRAAAQPLLADFLLGWIAVGCSVLDADRWTPPRPPFPARGVAS